MWLAGWLEGALPLGAHSVTHVVAMGLNPKPPPPHTHTLWLWDHCLAVTQSPSTGYWGEGPTPHLGTPPSVDETSVSGLRPDNQTAPNQVLALPHPSPTHYAGVQ